MDAAELLARIPRTHFVDGEFTDDEPTSSVENPATGEELTRVADGGPDVAMAALDAACRAQADWAATDPMERAEVLRRAFELTMGAEDDLALLMTLEMGKPLADARGEVAYGAEFFRWFSGEATRIAGRWMQAPTGGNRLLVARRPVGPVYAITPWNFPLAMGTRKIAPALAAGCTIVVKPASATPLTSLYLMQILKDAGVPAGVVNCVVTSDSGAVSEPILADPRLRKLTFTGSTEVGRTLLAQASEHVLRTSMELGGNAPFVVLADADVDAAVEGAMVAKFRNGGEACTAANRFLVHESVADEFTDKFVARARALVVGDGTADGTTIGPLVDEKTVAKCVELVEDAVGKGARAALGGQRLDRPGHFFAPTVLVDVPREARINREEVFGPVAPISTFTDLDDAVERANATEFGLVSYLCTRDVARAITIGERLESGMLALNTGLVSNPAGPFGGIKESGLGREGGAEGIDEYLETRYTAIGGL